MDIKKEMDNYTNNTKSNLNIIYNILTNDHHSRISKYMVILNDILPKLTFKMNDFSYFYIKIITSNYILKKVNEIILNTDNHLSNNSLLFYTSLKRGFNEYIRQIELINNGNKLSNSTNIIKITITDMTKLISEIIKSITQSNSDFDNYHNTIILLFTNISDNLDILSNRIAERQDVDYIAENDILNGYIVQLSNLNNIWLQLNEIKTNSLMILPSELLSWLVNIAKYKLAPVLPILNIPFNWDIFSEVDKVKIINKICKIESIALRKINGVVNIHVKNGPLIIGRHKKVIITKNSNKYTKQHKFLNVDIYNKLIINKPNSNIYR